MRNDPDCCKCTKLAVYATAIVGTFLIMGFLTRSLVGHNHPPALNTARAAERLKAQKELRAATTEALDHYGWIDQTKGLVRLPISAAMKLTVDRAANPAAARSNMLARVEKATAAPPKPPEVKFE